MDIDGVELVGDVLGITEGMLLGIGDGAPVGTAVVGDVVGGAIEGTAVGCGVDGAEV